MPQNAILARSKEFWDGIVPHQHDLGAADQYECCGADLTR